MYCKPSVKVKHRQQRRRCKNMSSSSLAMQHGVSTRTFRHFWLTSCMKYVTWLAWLARDYMYNLSETLKEIDSTQIKSDMRCPRISPHPVLVVQRFDLTSFHPWHEWCTFENPKHIPSAVNIWRPSGSLVGSATALVPSQHARAETTWSSALSWTHWLTVTHQSLGLDAKGCQRPIGTIVIKFKANLLDALK